MAALGPAVAWALLLLFMSSQSSLPVSLHSGLDKVAHFGAYSVLGALLAHAAIRLGAPLRIAVLAGILYGAMDELYQSTVPGRDAAVGDWIADALGVLAGTLFVLVFFRRRRTPASGSPERGPTATES